MPNRGEFSVGGVLYVKALPAPVGGFKGKIFYLLEADGTYNFDAHTYCIVGNPQGGGLDEWEWQLLGGGGQAPIGEPDPDGIFGAAGGIAGLVPTDKIVNAFDKIDVILEKLAPPKGWLLSQTSITLTATVGTKYTNRVTYDGLTRPNVFTSGTGITGTVSKATLHTTGMAYNNCFFDGDGGTISANYWDGSQYHLIPSSSHILTAADDTGVYGNLTIGGDVDPWEGVTGKANFWKNLRNVSAHYTFPTNAPDTAYRLQFSHTTSNSIASEDLYVYTDTSSPVFDSQWISSYTHTSNRIISGVPCLTTGDIVSFDAVISNAVLKYRHNGWAIEATTANGELTAANVAFPNTLTMNQVLTLNGNSMSVAASKYNDDFSSISLKTYSWTDSFVTGTATKTGGAVASVKLRIDSVSDPIYSDSSVMNAGSGTYPTSGYLNNTGLHTTSLVNTEGLQLVNGQWVYPSGNYTTVLEGGPNYSSISGTRWYVRKLSTISSATSVTFNITGCTNFGSAIIIPDIQIYLKVEGVTGWLDANSGYLLVGAPRANGEAALDTASSSTGATTVRRVTFGSGGSPVSGDVYVRIGLPTGSLKTFSSVS